MVIEATRPLPLGKFTADAEFRIIKIADNSDTSPLVITSDYNTKYPEQLTNGKKAYFRAYLVNEDFPTVTGKLKSSAVESTYTPA
jgi:hypothetical protein